MCGIGFINLTQDSPINSLALTGALLNALEARGTDAAGYGWRDEGDGSWYVKRAQRGRIVANQLAKAETVPPATRSVIVHTRYATLGDPAREVNNHPIIRPGIMLVHNGHVADHAQVTTRYRIKRTAQVDSEVIAHALQRLPVLDALDRIAEFHGTAAIAWLNNADRPGVVHAARIKGSPLVVGQTVHGDTIGASTEELLRQATGKVGIKLDWVCHIQPGTYLRLEDGVIADWYRFEVPWMPTTRPDYTRRSVYAR